MTIGRTFTMTTNGGRRTGAALVVALICVLLVSLLSTVLVRTALVQRDQLENDAWQAQAEWLVQSAIERAVASLESDVGYTGETWLPATGDGRTIGRVVIEVASSEEGGESTRKLRVTADVPDDPVRRSRIVREWPLALNSPSASSDGAAVEE
jgi:hypothetical protein